VFPSAQNFDAGLIGIGLVNVLRNIVFHGFAKVQNNASERKIYSENS
jgi:hypothetical protein